MPHCHCTAAVCGLEREVSCPVLCFSLDVCCLCLWPRLLGCSSTSFAATGQERESPKLPALGGHWTSSLRTCLSPVPSGAAHCHSSSVPHDGPPAGCEDTWLGDLKAQLLGQILWSKIQTSRQDTRREFKGALHSGGGKKAVRLGDLCFITSTFTR